MKKTEQNPWGAPGQGPDGAAPPPYQDGGDPYAAPWMAYPGGMPPPYWQGAPGQGGMPPHAWHPGYYAQPWAHPWGTTPPGPGFDPREAAPAGGDAAAGFSALLGDVAEKNGFGMFRELFNLEDGEFWKGAVVGAAVVLLMTNENLRASLVGGAAKAAEAVKTGFNGFSAPEGAAGEEAPEAHGPDLEEEHE